MFWASCVLCALLRLVFLCGRWFVLGGGSASESGGAGCGLLMFLSGLDGVVFGFECGVGAKAVEAVSERIRALYAERLELKRVLMRVVVEIFTAEGIVIAAL